MSTDTRQATPLLLARLRTDVLWLNRRCIDTIAADVNEAADELARLQAEVAQLQTDYGRACRLVADMHGAATGRPGEGPRLGVVEDVAAVRAEVEGLRKELAKYAPEPGELPRTVSQCWGCEGRPSGKNNPCDVCGRAALAAPKEKPPI